MIQLIAYTASDKYEDELKQLYLSSFPENERRDWNQFQELINHPNFNFSIIIKDNVLVGMITIWKWADFIFIEHFAIIESLRRKGIGEEVIKLLTNNINQTFVLEVEMPVTETAISRIDFYNRLGFFICSGHYFQPPYLPDREPVKMFLMTYPIAINQDEFIIIKTKLYEEVYQWNITDFP